MIAWRSVNSPHHSSKCRTHYKRIEELIAASPTPKRPTPSSRGKRKASELSPANEDKEDDISMYSRIRLRSIKLIELNVKKAKMSEVQTLFEVEVENSTIRCFCNFPDDDGNTVLCEDCNTWQHILCYYPQRVVSDLHVCVVCRPRSVDRQGANERQRRQQSQTQRQGASSYWSVVEQQDFTKYLRHFGTDFEAIANHMGSKTETMVSNLRLLIYDEDILSYPRLKIITIVIHLTRRLHLRPDYDRVVGVM